MYTTLSSFLVGLLIIHEYIRNYYPEEYKTFAYIIGYNSIYTFSRFQIFYNKVYKSIEIHIIPFFEEYSQKIYPLLEEIGFFEKTIRKDLKLVKNGMTVKFYKKDELFFLKRLKTHFEGTYDIMIYTDYDNPSKNGKINKVIYGEIPDNLDYKESQTTFILSEIEINNKKDGIIANYKIDFSSDKYNYFVVGNKFCRNFIKYFLRKHYNHIYKGHLKQLIEHEYSLKIIDNNANMVDLCKMKALTINQDDYLIEEFKEKEYKLYDLELYPDYNINGVASILQESCLDNKNDDINVLDGSISSGVKPDGPYRNDDSYISSNDDSYVKL